MLKLKFDQSAQSKKYFFNKQSIDKTKETRIVPGVSKNLYIEF